MRICYVAFQFWPSVGGSQSQAEKQARELRQLGQDVLIVTPRHQRAWPARETYGTLPIVRIGGWYRRDGRLRVGRFGHLLLDLCLFFTLWRLRHTYDLIHTLQLSPLAVIAALVGKLTHKPVIIGIQSTGPFERASDLAPEREQSAGVDGEEGVISRQEGQIQAEGGGDIATLQQTAWGGRWMLRYLRTSEAYYHILSSRSYLYLIAHRFSPERIIALPNGVDLQHFFPVEWAWPAAMSLREDRLVLCVARLEYAKGIDVLLYAWAQMMAMPPDWRQAFQPRLRLVGDGACRADLEALATTLDIRESVEFCGTRQDVARLLQASWGFVLPSRWEGLSNALLEAMACALPCVATRVSGSEDVLEQGVNGLLVEPERPQQLAYALRLMLEDADLAQRLGRQAYKTVFHTHQLSSLMQKSLIYYRYLLTRERMRHRPIDSLRRRDYSPEAWQKR